MNVRLFLLGATLTFALATGAALFAAALVGTGTLLALFAAPLFGASAFVAVLTAPVIGARGFFAVLRAAFVGAGLIAFLTAPRSGARGHVAVLGVFRVLAATGVIGARHRATFRVFAVMGAALGAAPLGATTRPFGALAP